LEPNSEFPEKIDALDLIITALKDHENRLDAISERLEILTNSLVSRKDETRRSTDRRVEFVAGSKAITRCHNWNEFRDRCTGSRNVSFVFEEDAFRVSAIINGYIFTYSERLPTKRLKVIEDETRFVIEKTHLNDIELFQFLIDGKLKCGVTLTITCSRSLLSDKQFLFDLNYDSARVKAFLAKELGVAEKYIVEGRITNSSQSSFDQTL